MTDATSISNGGRYHADTPWGAWRAAVATLIIVALSIAVPVAISLTFADRADLRHVASPFAWAPLILSQAIMALGAVWLAGRYQGSQASVLALSTARVATPNLALYFVVIALTSLAYTYVLFANNPQAVHADMDTFRPMVHSVAWPAYALIIVIGAPLSEELLFRGFLQSALAKSSLGFVGASVLTTVSWTALHYQYSLYGLAEIVVVGFALCWVLWRTGSLWSTIVLHALYNGAQFVGMRLHLFPWT